MVLVRFWTILAASALLALGGTPGRDAGVTAAKVKN
jgi:hypothetical protein